MIRRKSSLWEIGSLEYPFSREIPIGSEAFELVRSRFETSQLGDPR